MSRSKRGQDSDKEPKIEVTDRRSATAKKRAADELEEQDFDEADESVEDLDERGEDADDEPELDPEMARALFPQNVYDALSGSLLVLTELAWQKIGLRASPVSGKIERDMVQARVAIDTVTFIVDQLSPIAPPEQQQDLRNLVANLKINFARHAAQSPEPENEEN